MDNDQYDIEYDDDCVPRVDYIDRERDGRLARYAAAAHRTPGNEGFQTQAHTGPCSSRKVSDIASTSGGIGYTNGTLLPPLGTFWTHEELTAPMRECEEPKGETPSPAREPCTAGLGPERGNDLLRSRQKDFALKSAKTALFSDTANTPCNLAEIGSDAASATRSNAGGVLDGTRRGRSSSKHAVSTSRQPRRMSTSFGYPTQKHRNDASVMIQTQVDRVVSKGTENDVDQLNSESLDEILSSGSDSDADTSRYKSDGSKSTGVMDKRLGGLGLMSAFTRLHAFTVPRVNMTSMAGPTTSALSEPNRTGSSCRHIRGSLDARLRRVIAKAQRSQLVAKPAQVLPNQRGLQSTVFHSDSQTYMERSSVSFIEVKLRGEPRIETGLCLWKSTISCHGELQQDDSQGKSYEFSATSGDRTCSRPIGEHVDIGHMLSSSDTVAFTTRHAGKFNLLSGARLRMYPPWHELELNSTNATGFKRQRVIFVTNTQTEVLLG